MAITVSVGSGKGGTGKSMVLANLAALLARQGRKVCIVDLDTGGANAHIFFGLFEPKRTLTHFLTRETENLAEVAHTLDSFHGLQIIPGTGNTLQTANMNYQEKKRLLRALEGIDAEIILMDVGAGTSYHSLDFFMAADLQICVTMPEPTSILDFYHFLQLATIRKALSCFLAQSAVSKALKQQHFQTINEVFEAAEKIEEGSRRIIQKQLQSFHPLLVINRVTAGSRLNTLKLKNIASKYLGIYLPDLGEIPIDETVTKSLQAYMPICEYAPGADASLALQAIAEKLTKVVDLFLSKR